MAYSPDQKDVEGINELKDQAPKVCPNCGTRNFLVIGKCKKCGAELTAEAKDEAIAEWQRKAKDRPTVACYSALPRSPK